MNISIEKENTSSASVVPSISSAVSKKTNIAVCQGAKCGATGGKKIHSILKNHFSSDPSVEITVSGCLGQCSAHCNISIDGEEIISGNNEKNAVENVERVLCRHKGEAYKTADFDPFNLEDDKFLGI